MPPLSPLQKARASYFPPQPSCLCRLENLALGEADKGEIAEEIAPHFPHLGQQHEVRFCESTASVKEGKALRLGVVFSGGQAPGGHNVIAGIFDAVQNMHPEGLLIGFLGGPSGLLENKTRLLDQALLAPYRNQGGFDLLGSGRTKIETQEQLAKALEVVTHHHLDGLVIIGGDDSNTNAAILAEYFLAQRCATKVIGVPKTIDGDLKSKKVEISFGFDTACKVYSEMISNLMKDAISAKKYYHIVKLMGRSASHIALECALQTHPNAVLLGEEVAAYEMTFAQMLQDLADLIEERARRGKNYGVILIPEGLIEFVPEFRVLIDEINELLAKASLDDFATLAEKIAYVAGHLSVASASCLAWLPEEIQRQLLLERDPHGNVQVAQIEIEKLFILGLQKELSKRAKSGSYQGKFNAIGHYFGYEGRSAMPSNFDCCYTYALGIVAALLIDEGKTGYIAALQGLAGTVTTWQPKGIPLISMMQMEKRKGKMKPVIAKALVELSGAPFLTLQAHRKTWGVEDLYRCVGPMQFFGPPELCDEVTSTLKLEQAAISGQP